MFEGRLVGIYTSARAGAPMCAHAAIEAVRDRGLAGDRYANGVGRFSDRPGTGRQVTLIEREAVAALEHDGAVRIAEGDVRRNLVTEGVPLNHLVGRTFLVGGVVLRGMRLAEPCRYLADLTEPGVSRALVHRAGLRADILDGGVLRVGDVVREIEAGGRPVRG